MTTDYPSITTISAEHTRSLRSLVLRPGRPLNSCVWPGDESPSTLHFGLFVGETQISIASVYDRVCTVALNIGQGGRTWQLRGMATHPEYRGQGYGGLVLERIMADLRAEHGPGLIWCNARSGVVGFYSQHGFHTAGEEFHIEGVGPHFVMFRLL